MLAYLWADGDTQDRPELILVGNRTPVVDLEQTVAERQDRPIQSARDGLTGPIEWSVLCIMQIKLTVQSNVRWIIGREIPYTLTSVSHSCLRYSSH